MAGIAPASPVPNEELLFYDTLEITVKETPIRQSKLTPWKVFV